MTGSKSNDKDSKYLTKSPRSNSSISSASSTVSSANTSPKIGAKSRGSRRTSTSVTSSELKKRFKEKLRDKLRAGSTGKEEEELLGTDIVLDSGSQKSYIQLTNPIRGDPHSPLPETSGNLRHSLAYSRCSVIRSAGATSEDNSTQIDHDRYLENNVSFFANHHNLHSTQHDIHLQDKPVDFSPKNKYVGNSKNSGNVSGPSGFEMVLNYTMVA